jgi:hypothetical protein
MDRETVVGDWSMPLEVRLGRQRWIVPVGTSLTIGRDDSSSIPVDHVQVSRHHATVHATAEGGSSSTTAAPGSSSTDAGCHGC